MYRGPVNHPPYVRIAYKDVKWPEIPVLTDYSSKLYHRERILETSTLSCNEEEEEITKPPTR
jgi:hypothetical protein